MQIASTVVFNADDIRKSSANSTNSISVSSCLISYTTSPPSKVYISIKGIQPMIINVKDQCNCVFKAKRSIVAYNKRYLTIQLNKIHP